MSKETTNNTSTNEKTKLNKNTILWASLIILACIIVLVGSLINNKGGNNDNLTNDSPGYVEGQDYSNSNISTYAFEHTVLHGDDITEAVDNVQGVIDYLKTVNPYTRLQVGTDEYDFYIYNNNGECLAQSADGSTVVVFRKDGYSSIAFGSDTDELLEGYDIDVLSIIENVLTIARSDTEDKSGVTVFDMILSEDSDVPSTTHEYRVEIVGEDIFKEVYNGADSEIGENIISTLKSQVEQVSENEFIPHVIYTFIIDTENKALNVICDLIVDGEEHTNWMLDGYLLLDDWKLSDAWYSDEILTGSADNSFEELDKLMSDLENLILKYMDDNNIPVEDTESPEDEVNTTDGDMADEIPEGDNSENFNEGEENNSSDIDNETIDESLDSSLDVENNTQTSEE